MPPMNFLCNSFYKKVDKGVEKKIGMTTVLWGPPCERATLTD